VVVGLVRGPAAPSAYDRVDIDGRYLQNLINDSSGFTAIEYALIAALMAVAAMVAIA
jgi:hypothetical protein